MDEVVVEQFVKSLVGTGLTDEEEVHLKIENQPTQGLAAVQVVAEKDRPVGTKLVDVGGRPARGGVALAVLLALFLGQLRQVCRRILLNELRHQRQDAVVAVGDDRRREHLMEVLLGLVGPTWRMEHCAQRIESEQ